LSQALVERHGGQVPDTFEELEQLAGVVHKTASVVMSVAFQVVSSHLHPRFSDFP
jgi:endonuclease-3